MYCKFKVKWVNPLQFPRTKKNDKKEPVEGEDKRYFRLNMSSCDKGPPVKAADEIKFTDLLHSSTTQKKNIL